MTQSRTVLITGASGGIGAELARLFAADGSRLILVARGRTALEQLAAELDAGGGAPVRVIGADLSEPGAARRVWEEAAQGGEVIDVLVNNAGVGMYGPLAAHDGDALERMLRLNVVALTTLTRLALPGMLARRSGRILNLASLVAYQPGGPWMAAYFASKAFVLSFSRGLVEELRGTGVSVTALCPGAMRTGFDQRLGDEWAGRYRETLLYRRLSGTDPRVVALAGYHGLERGRAVVVPGLLTKLLAFAGGLPPRRLTLQVNRLLLRPRSERNES